ncbi:hypothetical protein GQ44DRAFT_201350 [Phaeosphaeriaceae sp. PMI808]|nr:hypothetical protein GQ44DRAFT_201350 [Phaeosphaeriaceae sp. PMI808]
MDQWRQCVLPSSPSYLENRYQFDCNMSREWTASVAVRSSQPYARHQRCVKTTDKKADNKVANGLLDSKQYIPPNINDRLQQARLKESNTGGLHQAYNGREEPALHIPSRCEKQNPGLVKAVEDICASGPKATFVACACPSHCIRILRTGRFDCGSAFC